MSISSRRWIRWIPDTPTEPTDTVVLTSPKGLFVDVRTILGIDEVATAALEKSEDELWKISAAQPGPKAADELHAHRARGRDELALSLDRLEWAFAGRGEDLGPAERGGKRRAWTHWVDNKLRDANGHREEAVMFPYQDGSTPSNLELEKGRMLNPKTGVEQDYEELWEEEANEAAGNPASKICIAMVAQHTEDGVPTGVVIRLGKYCQGVLRVGDAFVVERWLWHDGERVWKRVVRIGHGEIPCSLVCNDGHTLKVGTEFKPMEGGFHWRVKEVVGG